MDHIVFYFSPTGGTRRVAEHIGKMLDCGAADITVDCLGSVVRDDTLAVFCFPVFGGRVPKPMRERMTHIEGRNAPAVIVAVYGNRAVDDALAEMKAICEKSGFVVTAACEMIAPHSLAPEYGKDRPDAQDLEKLKAFLDDMKAKSTFSSVSVPGNPNPRFSVNVPVRPISIIGCVECGMCYENCPVGAISEKHLTRTNYIKCIGCMRCVHICTSGARRMPIAEKLAVKAALHKSCSKRKEPKFYL